MKYIDFKGYIEDLRRMEIKDFKKYLKQKTDNFGNIHWTRPSGSRITIKFHLYTDGSTGTLTLYYGLNNGNEVIENIALVSQSSNLGRGVCWYFICPKTGNKCRVLFFYKGYFVHRKALSGFYYLQQTKSRKNRDLYSRAVKDNINDEILEEYYKPYRRITYAGKYTKPFTRLTKRLEKANRVNLNNIFKI